MNSQPPRSSADQPASQLNKHPASQVVKQAVIQLASQGQLTYCSLDPKPDNSPPNSGLPYSKLASWLVARLISRYIILILSINIHSPIHPSHHLPSNHQICQFWYLSFLSESRPIPTSTITYCLRLNTVLDGLTLAIKTSIMF